MDTSSLPFLLIVFLLLVKSTVEQTPLKSSVERKALLQLRSSLGLRAKDWPVKQDPCLIWRGISCNNGSVVGINISGFRRTRIGAQNPQFAVDALVNLTKLGFFNASLFSLPGQIPVWFGESMRNLQVLDLSSCSIVGSIPLSLGNLTQLSALILSNNQITGSIPFSLGGLLNLSVLDLSSNLLSDPIPPGIGTSSSLQRLNFSGNGLTGSVPAQLGDLSSLVDLDLSSNLLINSLPVDLSGMKNLKKMLLRNNSLSGDLPGDLFRDLTGLEFIDLSQNNFSGAIPDALWSISTLVFVDFSGNNFTGNLPENSTASGARLNLSGNMYYGSLTSMIQRFSSVDLSANYFEGKVNPAYTKSNSSVSLNCLQNVTSQRTLKDCTSFYASKGLTFDNFGRENRTRVTEPPKSARPRKNHKLIIILAAVFGALGVVLLILLFLVFICTRKRVVTSQRGNGVGPIPTPNNPQTPGAAINLGSLGEAYANQKLLQATGDFGDGNLIKHGHSGDLYRGVLDGGIHVVVKKVDLNTVRRESHLVELDFFSKVSHPRLVPLLGHCLENENENEKYLVYKYMPNRDLSSSLYRKVNTDDDSLQSLDWITRLKIAIGTAEGLSYLHHECAPPFVHRDVQASSILLDDKFEVRLGSLSATCAQEGDTHHQSRISRFLRIPQASEQASSGSQTSTCSYDVYCFGKVLLELVTGKMGMSAANYTSLKEWLDQTLPYITIYDKELINKIVDPSLIVDEDLLEEVWAMAIVARSCLNPKPSRRPLMRYILRALENPLKVVREENMGSARLRTTSSRSSWNTAFGSWRHSSDVGPAPKAEGTSGGPANTEGLGSQRRPSREIFREPSDDPDTERSAAE